MITISICVITYNHEKLISECLNSILNQKTNFKIEIVIGEDGSTDNTRQVIKEVQKQNSDKITLLPDEGNLGMMPNFLRTLKNCNGDYIAICEGDDYWSDPDKLQKQVDFLEYNPEYTICFTNTTYYDQKNKIQKKVITSTRKTSDFYDLVESNFIATQTVMYRNINLLIPDGFEKLSVGDWPLHLLYAQHGLIGHLDDFTAVYRMHEANAWNYKKEIEKLGHINDAFIFLAKNLKSPYNATLKRKSLSLMNNLLGKYRVLKNSSSFNKLKAQVIDLPQWWLSPKAYYLLLKSMR